MNALVCERGAFEFFRKIEKIGEAEYAQEIVNRYFLILKFDEEMRRTENKR